MARKTKEITIDVPGRDFGKRFLLTEMPAIEAFKFATQTFFAVGESGLQVPVNALEVAQKSGDAMSVIRALAAFASQAVMGCSYAEFEPLMAKAWNYVQFIPEDGEPRPIDLAGDIEEVWSFIILKRSLLELHIGVSLTESFGRFIGNLAQHREVALIFAELAEAAKAA